MRHREGATAASSSEGRQPLRPRGPALGARRPPLSVPAANERAPLLPPRAAAAPPQAPRGAGRCRATPALPAPRPPRAGDRAFARARRAAPPGGPPGTCGRTFRDDRPAAGRRPRGGRDPRRASPRRSGRRLSASSVRRYLPSLLPPPSCIWMGACARGRPPRLPPWAR